MAVEALDPDRMVWRDRVDPVAARQLAAPIGVVPHSALNPGAGGHGRRKCLDASDELRGRLRVSQLDVGQVESAVDEMHVCVDEAGHEHRAVRIDHAGSRRSPVSAPRRSIRPPRAGHRGPRRRWPRDGTGSPVQTCALTMARETGPDGGSGDEAGGEFTRAPRVRRRARASGDFMIQFGAARMCGSSHTGPPDILQRNASAAVSGDPFTSLSPVRRWWPGVAAHHSLSGGLGVTGAHVASDDSLSAAISRRVAAVRVPRQGCTTAPLTCPATP